MSEVEGYAHGPVRKKHPTKATKLDLLKLAARLGGVDVVAVTQHFRLSEAGAKVKLWRLTRQSLLEVDPESRKWRGWRLTSAGRRHLQYLMEAEEYTGGTKGLLVSRLTAEVAELKAERDHWKAMAEDPGSVLQQAADMGNENAALRRALTTASREHEKLRHENDMLRAALARKYSR